MPNLKISIPADFYQEEVRCDFTVTTERKQLWAVQLDLLSELLSVCKKHGLRIYPDGGTLLGAVRHQGFIPWDDDIDMMMPRNDYQQLCQLAATEFQHPYFFQTEQTDPGCLLGHAQLHNSETSMFTEKRLQRYNFNMGIWIDIFPFDNVPDDMSERQKFLQHLRRLKHRAHWYAKFYSRYRVAPWPLRPFQTLYRGALHLFRKTNVWYDHFEQEAQRYNNIPTRQWAAVSFRPTKTKSFYDIALFDDTVELPFEFFSLTAPRQSEILLETMYGDWRKLVKGASIHGSDLFIDTEHSYKEYKK